MPSVVPNEWRPIAFGNRRDSIVHPRIRKPATGNRATVLDWHEEPSFGQVIDVHRGGVSTATSVRVAEVDVVLAILGAMHAAHWVNGFAVQTMRKSPPTCGGFQPFPVCGWRKTDR